MSGGLLAFNATDLGQELYASTMVPARDTLPKVAHFATQTIANGKVYIATQTTSRCTGSCRMRAKRRSRCGPTAAIG